MRTKEQIRIANREAKRRLRSKPPQGKCACGNPSAFWVGDDQECARCRMLETPTVRWSIIGAPQKLFKNEDELVKYVPLYERFKVSIKEFADSMLIHAHGDYILKIQ